MQTPPRWSAVLLVVLAAASLGSCGGGAGRGGALEALARALGRSSDDIGRQLDDLSRVTGRSGDDLARNAKRLATRMPPVSAVDELADSFQLREEFVADVVCQVLDDVADDGLLSADELFDALRNAALDAGLGDGSSFAADALEIMMEGDPDGEYDFINLTLDQLRNC